MASEIKVDTISEKTSANGVAIDSVTLKDGGATFTGAVTVGVDDTGKDVKLFGATSGSFLLWDESADALLLTDSTPIQIGDAQDLTLYHDGSHSYITNKTGTMKLATETSGIAITIGHTTSETTVADNLTVTGTTDTTGVLSVAAGVNFPDTQAASADANTLDDYEEGTWTPVFEGASSNPTVVYAEQFGRYVKIGRLCFAQYNTRTTSTTTGGGALHMTGLPFQGADITTETESACINNGHAGYWDVDHAPTKTVLSRNTSYCFFQHLSSDDPRDGGATTLLVNDMATGTNKNEVGGVLIYETV